MSSVFSVFCIGSNHASDEVNSTVASLGKACVGPKIMVDGVGKSERNRFTNFLGNARGLGMDDRVRAIVAAIEQTSPQVVNMVGHSRGAIISHMVANELGKAAPTVREINIFAIDPVNMSSHTRSGRHLRQAVKLGDYVGIIMENVSGAGTGTMFPSASMPKLHVRLRDKLVYYNLPGTHGSGTQPLTSAVGLACHGMAMRFMALWGSDFQNPPPTVGQMCNAYAAIAFENQATYNPKSGKVTHRTISNDKLGQSLTSGDPTVTSSKVKVGHRRDKAIEKYIGAMGNRATDFRNTPIFFNEYHAGCFEQAFPAVYAAFVGNRNPAAIDRELTYIQQSYAHVYAQLEQLGMV